MALLPEFEASFATIRDPKRRFGIDYAPGAEDRIVNRLKASGFEVLDYEIDPDDYRRYFVAARYSEDYPQYYPGSIFEKSLEHYLAARLLALNADDVYIDVASEHSPVPEIYGRLFGATTYKQDLACPPGLKGRTIGGNAASMPVPDGFASKMALHCSFEHFEGASDIGFVMEAARVLRPGGAVCIVPLYLFEEYAIQTDPVVAIRESVVFEPEAVVYCAEGWNNRHGRFYDPEHLASRILRNSAHLKLRVYRLVNATQVDSSCYARFALVIQKPAVS
jgi:hypothetical protein